MKKLYKNYIKQVIDFVLSLVALILLSPLFLIISVLVRLKLGSPIFFTQERPGKDGNIFLMYKFRTMTDARDEDGELLSDDIRLTRFGKALRSTSLDELPEMWNILKGDMSIVGPRPLLTQYLPLYNDHQKRRHEVKPGLTGYAQVNGRNTLDWPKRFDLDVKYIDNINFLLDCKIILQTIKKVIVKEGISSESSSTMEPFKGNKNE